MTLAEILPWVVPVILTVLAHKFGVVDLGSSGSSPASPVKVPVTPTNAAHPVLALLEQELVAVVRGVLQGAVVNAAALQAPTVPNSPVTPK